MSRSRKQDPKARRSRKRRRGRSDIWARDRARARAMWLKVGGAAAALVVLTFIAGRTGGGSDHPDPRPNVTNDHVVSPARYASSPRVAETYRLVAAVPEIIDGVFCYCYCSEHSGHRSLLDCFESDHAARCDVCLSEATIAYTMSHDGQPLSEIRREIDSRYTS